MTRFERDYRDAQAGNEIEVLTRRKAEIEALEKRMRECKYKIRVQCMQHELETLKAEYKKIDDLF